jgi:hypothetical protein
VDGPGAWQKLQKKVWGFDKKCEDSFSIKISSIILIKRKSFISVWNRCNLAILNLVELFS